MRCFFLVVIGCCGFASLAHATTSCSPQISFLGFSNSNNELYYEVTGGGDCVPFKVMYQANLQTKKNQAVVRMESDDSPDWPMKFAQQKAHWLLDHKTVAVNPAPIKLLKSVQLGSPIMESDREVGMHEKPKNIKQVYQNKNNPALWVVISAHCYEASWSGYNERNCPTIDHLAVYQRTGGAP